MSDGEKGLLYFWGAKILICVEGEILVPFQNGKLVVQPTVF